MATIGKFEKRDAEYNGTISTLTVQVVDVRIAPEDNRPLANSPSHRIFLGNTVIGAAWTKRGFKGLEYLNCKIDDPGFIQPIYPTLVKDDDSELTYSLVWSRPNEKQIRE